jgi:hypothetical protein
MNFAVHVLVLGTRNRNFTDCLVCSLVSFLASRAHRGRLKAAAQTSWPWENKKLRNAMGGPVRKIQWAPLVLKKL